MDEMNGQFEGMFWDIVHNRQEIERRKAQDEDMNEIYAFR